MHKPTKFKIADLSKEEKDTLVRVLTSKGLNYHIVTHTVPDGDTIGAAVGLGSLLAKMTGSKVRIYGEHYNEKRFGFLFDAIEEAGLDVNRKFIDTLPDNLTERDIVICVDCAVKNRLGIKNTDTDFGKATVVVFDHHKTSEPYGHVNIIDEDASSCCDMIVWMFRTCAIVPDMQDIDFMYRNLFFLPYVCEAFYVGMCTDTLCFQTASVAPTTFTNLAQMTESIRHDVVGHYLWSNTPEDVARYKGYILSRFSRLNIDGKLNVTYFISTKDDDLWFNALTGYGVSPDMKTLVVSTLRQIENTDVAVSVSQLGNGGSKISIRVYGDAIKANEIMAKMGGGGHEAAAGAVVSYGAQEAFDTLIYHIKQALN